MNTVNHRTCSGIGIRTTGLDTGNMHPKVRRILVVNGKGGCGKTTIATNLAVAYAARQHSVALIDNDPQAASTHWGNLREPDLPTIHVVPAFRRTAMYETQCFQNRVPAATSRIVVDGQSNARDQDLNTLIRQADVILIPIMPSAIDMHVGERFVNELLKHRSFRNAPRPVAAIASRVQPNTEPCHKLTQFLECLDIPCVATFRDSPVYTQAAEQGCGVVDMKDHRAARKECAAWWQLLDWIDAQPRRGRITVNELRQQPKAAKRHRKGANSLSA